MSSLNPAVKATKKSAFSCDPCRRRKVKCGGEKPSCDRCIARNDTCLYKLSPTISYTQKLENKVNELEHLVSELQKLPVGSIQKTSLSPRHGMLQNISTPGESTIPELSGTFEGLKFDDKGGVTYHGATSFFQLPTPTTQEDHPRSIPWEILGGPDEGNPRKQRLVNNAWQQRALETLSETPVGLGLAIISSW